MGQRLIRRLLDRGHHVRALVRSGSEKKLASGCTPVLGDALDASSYAEILHRPTHSSNWSASRIPAPQKLRNFGGSTYRQDWGPSRPRNRAGINHFIYLSVAHPAPLMHAYIAVRAECETAIEAAGLNATILRPWYVLGPGHRWPYLLLPLYKLGELFSSTREGTQRLGLVTLEQMITALTFAVENPVRRIRVLTVPEIRAAQLEMAGALPRRVPR